MTQAETFPSDSLTPGSLPTFPGEFTQSLQDTPPACACVINSFAELDLTSHCWRGSDADTLVHRTLLDALENRSTLEAFPCANWDLHTATGTAEGFQVLP